MRPLLFGLILLLLCGCAPEPALVQPSLSARVTASPTSEPISISNTPTAATVTAAASPSPTPTVQVCSPLEGIPIEQLAGMVTNPYNPPPPGSDDPHEGIDLSEMLPDTRMAIPGRTVQAVLDGRVAAVIIDRFPYGNAIIIETALTALPAGLESRLALPTPDPLAPPPGSLTCPIAAQTPATATGSPGIDVNGDGSSGRAVYIVYAHLEQAPAFQPGDAITCGQALGTVGMTGNALNPHLHLEIRSGPAGVQFASMAHYDVSASLEEMAAYCAWRVSGKFQLVDPLNLFILNQ